MPAVLMLMRLDLLGYSAATHFLSCVSWHSILFTSLQHVSRLFANCGTYPTTLRFDCRSSSYSADLRQLKMRRGRSATDQGDGSLLACNPRRYQSFGGRDRGIIQGDPVHPGQDGLGFGNQC